MTDQEILDILNKLEKPILESLNGKEREK